MMLHMDHPYESEHDHPGKSKKDQNGKRQTKNKTTHKDKKKLASLQVLTVFDKKKDLKIFTYKKEGLFKRKKTN